METSYSWKIGQRVRMIDEDDGSEVYGSVTDKASDCVYIKWEDLSEPTQHMQNEYYKIKIVPNGPGY